MAFIPNDISQQDPAWKNQKLGFSNRTIGTDGCTLTCLSILVNGFGHNETPASLNEQLKALGRGNGFINEMIVWGGLPRIFPEFSLRKIIICREDTQRAPLNEIDAALARGQAVLVEIDRSPARGIQNHWVVLYKKEGGDYLMNDPWPHPVDGKPTLLSPRYAAGRLLAKVITAVVWYEVPDNAPPLDDGMYVQVSASATSGLRMRAQPTTASDTRALEPAGSYLRVLEDEELATAKIGMTGEWLHVRDLLGVEGYVAAWFVDAVERPAPPANKPVIPPVDEPVDESPAPPANEPVVPPVEEPTDPIVAQPEPPAEQLKVYVSHTVGSRGLRMRERAGLGGNLVTVVDAGAELTVLEEANAARAKLGVDGQWLSVQAGHHKGYIAAWLVALDLNAAPEPVESLVDEPVEEPVSPPAETPVEEPPPPVVDEPVVETPPPTPALKVYVDPDVGRRGLRMRAKPSLVGNLVTTLQPGAELTVLDDAETAQTKVGVNNKWLHVEHRQYQGYVAAWLLVFEIEEEAAESPVAPSVDEPVDAVVVNDTISSSGTSPSKLRVTVFPSLGRNGLRMRAEPNVRAALLGVLAGGTRLIVLDDPIFAAPKVGTYGQWLHVRTPEGRDGYVAAWYVKMDEAAPHIPPPSSLVVYVTSLARGGLRMRGGPSTGYKIVKTIKASSALTVLENEEEAIAKIGATGQWLHVRDESGTEGYVAAWFIVR